MVVPAMSTRPTCSGTVCGARQHIVPFKTPHSSIQAAIWRQRTSIAQEPVSRTVVVTKATRDARFAYHKDIQTKLRPGDFADREDNKSNHLSAAQDWQTVVKLFYELGDNLDRNISLVGDMLVSLQRLLPPPASSSSSSGRLSADESNVLAAGIMNICSVLVENIQKVNNNLLINVIWALALLPDPAKTLKTPAAAAARARCVGVFGAAVLNRMSRYTAEEVFHVGAGLAMLGFKPPRTLQSDRAVTTFGALVERRTVKVMHYLSPKAIADAGYVAARLVAPGDMSEEWLKLFAYVSRQHISTMQPEALIYAGYALARHGFKPSNTWRKRYMDGIFGFSKTLEGEEFPMVLFTLAKWQQQQQQQGSTEDDLEGGDDLDFQQQSLSSSSGAFTTSSSGPQPSQTLINNLLLASHSNRALRQLPLNQIVVMLKSLTELDCYISPQWMQRLWPVINAQIDAAADDNASSSSSSSALSSNLAALLVTIPKLNPKPELPGDFLDIAVGNLGLGLDQLIQQNPRDLAAAWAALQHLHYTPDQIFMRQMQQAVMQGMSNVACKDLDALLQLGIAAASSSSDAAAEQYAQQMLQGFCDEVQDRVGLVTGDTAVPAAAAAAGGVGRIALQWQQQQERRQQLISNAAAEGLWRLPQTLNVCIDVLSAAAAASSSSSSNSALSSFHVQLQQIWRQAAVGLASVMPTEPLLVLLNFLLDLESNKQQQQQLGLANAADRQQLTLDILRSGVYNHIAASSSSSSRGRKSATAAAAAGSSADQQQQQMKKDLLADFSVADWQELLVIIADAGLQDTAPGELLTLASESLHKALSELPKAKIPSEDMSEEEYSANESILAAIDTFLAQQLVDELVITLKQDYGFSLPAKVKAKYKTVKQLIGQEVPIELTLKSSRKKAVASSISSKVPKASAAAPAAAAVRESIVAKPTPAAALKPAAAAACDSDVVGTPSSISSSSDGLVRSSRSRSRSSTGV